MQTISASRIQVYKTCARQYQLKYIIPHNDRPADDKNVAALLGTALHKAIESQYKDAIPAVQTFQNVMADTLAQWQTDDLKINAADYYAQALKIGTNILRNYDWDQFKPSFLEYAFTLPFPNAMNPIVYMTGYIDLIDSDREIVVDFKSTSSAPGANQLTHNPQFLIYSWAYEQLFHKKPKHVYWYHLRTQKIYEYPQVNYEFKINQLIEDIKAMLGNTLYARKDLDTTCLTKCSFFNLCYGKRANEVEIE